MSSPDLRPKGLTPPRTEKRPSRSTWHGVELVDDYAWLRADNWQQVLAEPTVLPADIRAYLEAENAYTAAAMADTEALQAALFAELKGRIKEDDSSVPQPDGPFAYASSYITGGQYPRFYRTPRAGGTEEILIDGNKEGDGKPYWSLGAISHSPDHRLIAYSTDEKGSEQYTVRVREAATGTELADILPGSRGGLVWSSDASMLFYVRLDDHERPTSVWRHRLGKPVADDVCVYEEADAGFMVSVGETQSGDYVLIEASDHQTSEVRFIPSATPEAAPRLVAARRPGHEYGLDHQGDRFVILTNSGGAEDFRICTVPIATPDEAHWVELVAHKPGRLILDIAGFEHHLARLERENGLPRIVIRERANGAEHAIAFDEEAYSLGMSAGYEHATTMLRFTYSSMTTPAEVYDYDMAARTRVLRKRQEVPSGHDPARYVTRRIYAPAADGETVPVTLLYAKDTPLDGSAPAFLYAYGSYGVTIPASFSTSRLSLVDRGFVFALAHIRGGKDKGYRWYTDGKLARKMNTFTDFIAAGRHLAKAGYTREGRIVANGGSAGGMLMGVAANLAPDLFLGIIADVPFVDVMNTMLDADLPLTPPEWLEWGNPIESREQFDWIAAYSPYENVAAKAYPHIFAYGGLTDPRVTYWEPAKWVARLRELKTDDNLLILKTNMDAGHGGASGRFEALKETALDYAFALKVAGLAGAAAT